MKKVAAVVFSSLIVISACSSNSSKVTAVPDGTVLKEKVEVDNSLVGNAITYLLLIVAIVGPLSYLDNKND